MIPISLGGLTEEENLWLACSLCNNHKGNRIATRDALTGEIVPFFNPRRQVWAEHFAWSDAGARMIERSEVGRITILALQLNRPSLVFTRHAWISVGWHPPQD